MTIEKLPSGSYRATIMEHGKRYRKTFDHKPTQKEVLQALAGEMSEKPKKTGMTFSVAAGKYCDSKKNTLSPKTYREYILQCKRLPEWFLDMSVDEIEQVDLNKLVSDMSGGYDPKSPKTISNAHGFVSAVLRTFRPNMVINTTLPQKRKTEPYIPSVDEVKLMLQHLKGTEFEIPFILGCYGMRRSEICALTPDDIEDRVVHINKALVQNEKNEWVVKSTKTTQSTRDIVIPQDVADKIREQGYVYKGFPHSISKHLSALEQKLGINHFSMHKLRHYFASRMSAMGIPDADILAMGGWETDHVMKTVYRHSMIGKEADAKKRASDKLTDELFN